MGKGKQCINGCSDEWLIYDARYHTRPDRAIVMSVCRTEREAREEAPDYGADCVVVKTRLHVEKCPVLK